MALRKLFPCLGSRDEIYNEFQTSYGKSPSGEVAGLSPEKPKNLSGINIYHSYMV